LIAAFSHALGMLIDRGRGYTNMRYLLLKAHRMAVTNTEYVDFQKPRSRRCRFRSDHFWDQHGRYRLYGRGRETQQRCRLSSRTSSLASADVAGGAVGARGARHYLFSPVEGEAIVPAMKTACNWMDDLESRSDARN
jgi:hypothetical protein